MHVTSIVLMEPVRRGPLNNATSRAGSHFNSFLSPLSRRYRKSSSDSGLHKALYLYHHVTWDCPLAPTCLSLIQVTDTVTHTIFVASLCQQVVVFKNFIWTATVNRQEDHGGSGSLTWEKRFFFLFFLRIDLIYIYSKEVSVKTYF